MRINISDPSNVTHSPLLLLSELPGVSNKLVIEQMTS